MGVVVRAPLHTHVAMVQVPWCSMLIVCCLIFGVSAKNQLSAKEYFRKARHLVSNGEIEQAKDMFSYVLVHPQVDEEMHTKAFREYIQLFDRYVDGTLQAAKLFNQNGYRNFARSLAQSTITTDPNYSPGYLLLADLTDTSSAEGREEVIRYLHKALETGAGDSQVTL